ncbi:MAG: polysaccharide pyruvyl transferase family protein [Pseudomonadota bacterium]
MDPSLARLLLAEDQEAQIRVDMAKAIRLARSAAPHRPELNGPLKLLLVGYAGAGNIGADIKMHETARQLRAILPGVELGIMARGTPSAPIEGAVLEVPDGYFPDRLSKLVARYDGVVVVEGSLYKSTFSNTLTTMLVGAMALAVAQGKPAIAFGVEAGRMDPDLAAFVRTHGTGATVICRSERALEAVIRDLGFPATLGADTAWTFPPAPPAAAEALLGRHGWDGAAPVLALCPINPFWWPVKPDALRAMAGEEEDLYQSIFYHTWTADRAARLERYLAAWAGAAQRAMARTGAMPILIAMETLDIAVCERLAARLGNAPVLAAGQVQAAEIVAVLRRAALVVTSRYHAALTAIPAGGPVIGVTMDERISNLMAERGCPEMALPVEAPDLAERLRAAVETCLSEGAAPGLQAFLTAQRARQARMGRQAAETLARAYPALAKTLDLTAPLDQFLPADKPTARFPRLGKLSRRQS